jgi:lipoprotein signal peptidase
MNAKIREGKDRAFALNDSTSIVAIVQILILKYWISVICKKIRLNYDFKLLPIFVNYAVTQNTGTSAASGKWLLDR